MLAFCARRRLGVALTTWGDERRYLVVGCEEVGDAASVLVLDDLPADGGDGWFKSDPARGRFDLRVVTPGRDEFGGDFDAVAIGDVLTSQPTELVAVAGDRL